jgi:hypothetical protein
LYDAEGVSSYSLVFFCCCCFNWIILCACLDLFALDNPVTSPVRIDKAACQLRSKRPRLLPLFSDGHTSHIIHDHLGEKRERQRQREQHTHTHTHNVSFHLFFFPLPPPFRSLRFFKAARAANNTSCGVKGGNGLALASV